MEEIWKTTTTDDNYQVSNLGRVKCVVHTNHRILRPFPNSFGYMTVSIRLKRKKTKAMRVHRLLALTFLGEPKDGLEVNHIDGDKENNRLDNLEYCTRKENMVHRFEKEGTSKQGEVNKKNRIRVKKWKEDNPERVRAMNRKGNDKFREKIKVEKLITKA